MDIVIKLPKAVKSVFDRNKGLSRVISKPKLPTAVVVAETTEKSKLGFARRSCNNESLINLNYRNQSIIANKKVRKSTDKGMKVRPIKRNRRENSKELEYIRRIDSQMLSERDLLIRSINKGVGQRIKHARNRAEKFGLDFVGWLIEQNLERYAYERGHLLPNEIVEYVVQGRGESPFLVHTTRKLLGKGWI